MACLEDNDGEGPQGWGETEAEAVSDLKQQLAGEEDPFQSEDYQRFVAEVSKGCSADDCPCDSCLAGGICDGPSPEYDGLADDGEHFDDEA